MFPQTANSAAEPCGESLEGVRVAFLGKLAGMSRRDAQQLIREQGGIAIDAPDESVQLIVLGEEELPLAPADWDSQFSAAARQGVDEGRIEVVTETQLWQRLGLVETEPHLRRLYTPAMLADLLHVPVAVVRRWHRRGLIVPTREVRRLAYFDFQEVATARRLAELLATGMSPQTIEKKLAELARYLPSVQRPLAQLSIIVEGKHLLLRQGDGLVAPGGQLWFDFQPPEGVVDPATEGGHQTTLAGDEIETTLPLAPARAVATAASVSAIVAKASSLEDEGELEAAADMYRAALAAGGPNAEVCFALAELLYRIGDVTAARERYFMTIELDEEYVEARANLGCVLAELGQRELAVAAFEGALTFHDEYPDVHYHIARTLDDLDRRDEAEHHWRAFLALAPESPWAATARLRISGSSD
jgi:tetratricopeptide (TPR) repeat protein